MAVTGGGASGSQASSMDGLIVGAWPGWQPTFRLVHQLGNRGAEGTTFRAERLRKQGQEWVPTGEQVALKIFDRDAFFRNGDDRSRPLPDRLQDLEDLAHTVGSVPGVVRYRTPFVGPAPQPPGVQPDPDDPVRRTYLPMELVEGSSLQQLLEAAHDLDARRELLKVMDPLAATLEGLVAVRPAAPLAHRDLKPANIMVSAAEVTLVDLGLLVGPTASVSAGVGSFGFMAPEQQQAARLEPSLAHRVDWFGFYATTAAILTGQQPPWSTRQWEPWLASHSELTPRARHLLLTAAAADPRDRPAPWEWLPQLRDALDDSRRVSVLARARTHGRQLRRIVALGTAACLIATLGVVASNLHTAAAVRQALPRPVPAKVITAQVGVSLQVSSPRSNDTDPSRLTIQAGDRLSVDATISHGAFGDAADATVTLHPGLWRNGVQELHLTAVGPHTNMAQTSVQLLSDTPLLLVDKQAPSLSYNNEQIGQFPAGAPGSPAPVPPDLLPTFVPPRDLVTEVALVNPGPEAAVHSTADIQFSLLVEKPPAPAAAPLAYPPHDRIASAAGCRGSLQPPRSEALLLLSYLQDVHNCWVPFVGPLSPGDTVDLLIPIRNGSRGRLQNPVLAVQPPGEFEVVAAAVTSGSLNGPWHAVGDRHARLVPLRDLLKDEIRYVLVQLTWNGARNFLSCDGSSDYVTTTLFARGIQVATSDVGLRLVERDPFADPNKPDPCNLPGPFAN